MAGVHDGCSAPPNRKLLATDEEVHSRLTGASVLPSSLPVAVNKQLRIRNTVGDGLGGSLCAWLAQSVLPSSLPMP